MKMLLVLLAAGLASAGRLENTYLPPSGASGAAQAGGQDLPLPSLQLQEPLQQQAPRTHTEAVVNTYLPPASNIVVEAKLQQPPKPLGNVGILRQQGLQSTLGSGAPAPLLPQQAPKYTSAFATPSQASPSFGSPQPAAPKASSLSFGSQQSSSFGSQPSSAPAQQSFSFGSQQFSAPAQQSFSQISTYSQQQSSFPKTNQQASFGFQQQSPAPKLSASFGSQQSSFPSQQAFSPSSSAFGGQQQQSSSGAGLRQGGSFSSAAPSGQPVAILRSANVNNGDGSYSYSYETENGIEAQEQGELRQQSSGRQGESEGVNSVQGGFAFTAPDNNQRYTLTYTADENGFHAYGEHLPTPPPIPEAILRSIELNARAEQQQQQEAGYRYQQGQQQQDSGHRYQQEQQQQDSGYRYQQQQQKQDSGYSYQQPAPVQQALPQIVQRQGYQQQNQQQQSYQPQSGLNQQQGYQQSTLRQQPATPATTASYDAARDGYRY